MRVPVCLSACFCGLNPRTVPQLSLNKLRAPLGYRGLVLGLNVSCFFRSLGTSSGRSTCRAKLDQAEVADIITSQKNCGHLFLCLHFFNFCLAVAVDLDVVPEL